MTDYTREERETDDLIDVWHDRLAPMTQAEIDAAIKRISKNIEALDDEEIRTAD